jgi:class 3 adenylate cyclase
MRVTKTRDYLGERMPAILFAQWRGRPLYIFLAFLSAQLLIIPPVMWIAVQFTTVVTRVPEREFLLPISLGVGSLVVLAYLFWHHLSRGMRRFLASLLQDSPPVEGDLLQEEAMVAWHEAVVFPQRVIGRVIAAAVVVYFLVTALFVPRYGLSLALVGGVVATVATIALSQVLFLFYMEGAMQPIVRLTLAVGARPGPTDLHQVRLQLRAKLLLLILLIVSAPVTAVGLFGYGQAVRLGGDPAAALRLTGLVALVASSIALALALLLVRSISTPLREIQRGIAEVSRGNLDTYIRPLTTDEISELGLHFNVMLARLRQMEGLKAAFGRYVSDAVRDGILGGQITLGGERREVTILFTDIRDFTTWCEQTPPESVIQTLNSYYENLIQALAKYGGTVTRYTGDGVLALFGAPLEDSDHALHAVQAAWEAHVLLEKFNAIRRTLGAFELRTGFGIHTGVAVVGSIGCEARAEYTPIGDPANVASRIEGLNRELGTAILISDEVYRRVADHVATGKRAETPVKGRSRPVQVVEVVGLRPCI